MGRRVSVRRVVERAPDGRLLQSATSWVTWSGSTRRPPSWRAGAGLVEVPLALVTAARLGAAVDRATSWRSRRSPRAAGARRRSRSWTAGCCAPTTASPGGPTPCCRCVSCGCRSTRRWPHAPTGTPRAACRCCSRCRPRRAGCSTPRSGSAAGRREAAGPRARATARTATHAPDPAHPVVARTRSPTTRGWRCTATARRRPATGRALLTRHRRRSCFASVRRDGRTVAIGRGTVDDEWLGITSMESTPSTAGRVWPAQWPARCGRGARTGRDPRPPAGPGGQRRGRAALRPAGLLAPPRLPLPAPEQPGRRRCPAPARPVGEMPT